MTSESMDQIMSKINRTLRKHSRSVIILMDNAGCHPEELQHKYANIKIVFLPPNTTSVFQPLDLGMIKIFQVLVQEVSIPSCLGQD